MDGKRTEKEEFVMIGLLYKEFKQNSFLLLMTWCGSFFLVLLFLLFSFLTNNDDSDVSGYAVIIGFVWSSVFFCILGAAESSFMESSDKKKWAYFVKSTPETEKGEVGAKYLFVLMCTLGMLFWIELLNCILADIIDIPYFADPLIYVAMLQIFIKSLQFPMTMRFGGKMGSYVRIAVILVALVAFGIVALYYKGFTLDGLYSKLMIFYDDIIGQTEGKTVTKSHLTVYSTANILACMSLVFYYISYKISCRMYLKGVEANYAR